jgi:hypothetical protein
MANKARTLKSGWRRKLASARQRFVLTAREKRVVGFILAAFVLGLGTKYYRDNHRQASPTPPKTVTLKQSPDESIRKAVSKDRKNLRRPKSNPEH